MKKNFERTEFGEDIDYNEKEKMHENWSENPRNNFGMKATADEVDVTTKHLRDVEKDDKNASKPVARHLNLPNLSMQHMSVCGLSLHQESTESRKTLNKNLFFKSALLILTASTNAFHSTNLLLFSTLPDTNQ